MVTRAHGGKRHQSAMSTAGGVRRIKPIARAIALALATGGVIGSANAQQAFSPGWFASKGAAQSAAAATGKLPNGSPASSLTRPPRSQAERQQLQSSINNLNLAARAIAAQQAAQQAARDAALATSTSAPDGLVDGGLKVDTNALTAGWLNASAPEQTVADGMTTVTIEQTGDKAILNWETFNVGRNTTVSFEQEANWSVLNRVNDPNARPSQIQGQIKADGSVYILNRNGILFTGTSQVNVGSLTASAVNISDDKFKSNFISTAWDQNGPTFQVVDNEIAGLVAVEQGARIETAASGRAMLLGGDVRNDGSISAPGGQVLLAAAQQVYLRASDDSAMRGLYVELGNGGLAVNNGLIEAPRGNVTLAGRDVTLGGLGESGERIAGVITATTGLTANGSITLQAADQAERYTQGDPPVFERWGPGRSGNVTVDAGAVLQILPELDDEQTAATDALDARSAINLSGRTVAIAAGALLQATSGTIDIDTVTNPSPQAPDPFEADDSLIRIDGGAVLDVSGTRGVDKSVLDNFVQVELRGAELADNPQDYDALYGNKVWVDIRESGTFSDPLMQDVEWIAGAPGEWRGSPLFNASAYIGTIKRGIGELTSRGGDINLGSAGNIVVREGAQLNVSGGTIDYEGANVPVSYVTDAAGRSVPVARAEFGADYIGIGGGFAVKHDRWGVSENYSNSVIGRTWRHEVGYTEGQAAGTVRLVAPKVALDGDVLAVTEASTRQAQPRPIGGTLILGDASAVPTQTTPRDYVLDQVSIQAHRQVLSDADFDSGGLLPDDYVTVLSTDALNESGLGDLQIHADRRIDVAADARLDLGDSSSVTLRARSIDIEGHIRAAGGSIDAQTMFTTVAGDVEQLLRLGGTAVLDVAARWTNERTDRNVLTPVNGGSIRLWAEDRDSGALVDDAVKAGNAQVVLEDGAVLDVSGGGGVDIDRRLASLGDAGAIEIAGLDIQMGESVQLRGYALASSMQAGRGGSLSITGRGVVSTLLTQDFLSRGGFAAYSLTDAEDLTVAADTHLVLMPQHRLLPNAVGDLASDTALEALGTPTVLAQELRGPASLQVQSGYRTHTLDQYGLPQLSDLTGTLTIENGASIDAGIGGTVRLGAGSLLYLDGILHAPGGQISLDLRTPLNLDGITPVLPYENQRRAIWLGDNARLLAEGAWQPSFNVYGLRTGNVLDGGTVALNVSGSGYVVTEAGSLIDVSGGLATLDLAGGSSTGLQRSGNGVPVHTATEVWSDAGTVRISANDGAVLDGRYDAGVQDARAQAGRFDLDFGTGLLLAGNRNIEPLRDRAIVIRGDGEALAAELQPGDALFSAEVVPQGANARTPLVRVASGAAQLSAEQIENAGFATIDLESRNRILFDGDVDLQAGAALILDTSAIGTTDPEVASRVRLSAPYVRLGDTDRQRLIRFDEDGVAATIEPTAGLASLHVEAGAVLDFAGRTVLQGMALGEFVSQGDVVFTGVAQPVARNSGIYRRIGRIATMGDLVFGGRQLYPASGADFTVSSSGTEASITILPGDNTVQQPLSVGGSLSLQAPTLVHEGVLRAPLGQLVLDAGADGNVTVGEGSVSDVALHDRTLPFGTLINDVWYQGFGTEYAAGSIGTLAELIELPSKRISITGDSIDIRDGARLDLSGGGDVSGYEFVPGTGGSRDLLMSEGVFAVLPGAQPGIAPAPTSQNSAPGVGNQVWLDGAPGLTPGWYTLLPAEYALQPGAFRVTLAAAASDRRGPIGARQDGAWYVSGRYGSSLDGSVEARNSTFLVVPGETLRNYSEYDEVIASRVFADAALKAEAVRPQLAADAGQLVLAASRALTLDGNFDLRAGEGGRGGLVDIASASIAVVAEGAGPADGYALSIEGNALSAMGAQSLLLGGTRTQSADGVILTSVADSILVANDQGSSLAAPEILLLTRSGQDDGADGRITVADGAVIHAEGEYIGDASPWIIGTPPDPNDITPEPPAGTGQGALLALSNAGGELLVQRHDIGNAAGTIGGMIGVAAGATLSAERSVLFDATAGASIDAQATIAARSLELASSAIHFGDAPSDASGFVANSTTLAALSQAERLVLRSYGTIDFHDRSDFSASTGELVLDGAALRRQGSGNARVSADILTLRNTSGTLAAGAEPVGAGTLSLEANELVIGQGDSRILGYGESRLSARETRFEDAGGLTAGIDQYAGLTLVTPFVTAGLGADSKLAATGALRLVRGEQTAPEDRELRVGTGGLLTLTGNTVDVGTEIRLPAGAITVQAQGDLSVSAGADLDVSGRTQDFFDQSRTLPAGDITLISQAGNVHVASGARLDLSDPNGGGQLTVTVPEGSLSLEGEAAGGRFGLDAGSLPGFGAMQAVLNTGGFTDARHLRLRSGDALLDGVTQTRDFRLTVDEGGIVVTGTIDASGETGGNIELSAADDVVLSAGARLTVAGENFDGSGQGGTVFLSAGANRIVDGENVTNEDAVVDIQAGSLIDLGVANAAASAKVVTLDAVGSSIMLPAANTLGFPEGTPAGTQIVVSVAATITYADGTTAALAADTPTELPAGATLTLQGAGGVSVVSGEGKVAVVLPQTGAFDTVGATTVTSVPVMLTAPGSTIHLAGGTPVVLPNGTPGDDIITTTADSVSVTTVSDGSQVTVTAGQSQLQLSAGSALTLVNSGGDWSLPVDRVTLNNNNAGTHVTLTRAGASGLTLQDNSGQMTFRDGLPDSSRLVFGTTTDFLGVTIPAGGETAVQLAPAAGQLNWRLFRVSSDSAGISLHFPEGTPAGTQLQSPYGGDAYTLVLADGGVVNIPAQSGAFSVPPGATLTFSTPYGQLGYAPNSSAPLSVVLRNSSAAALVQEFSGKDIRVTDVSAGTVLNPRDSQFYQPSTMYFEGGQAVSMQLVGTSEIRGGTLSEVGAGVRLTLPDGGSFNPQGNGNLQVALNGGGNFDIADAQLQGLAAGSVLTLGEDGQIQFASGSAGPIPLVLPASAQLAGLSGASVLDLGGGQAGTLHLRAPQTAGGTGLGVRPIDGIVLGAARIIAEGYKVYDLSNSAGQINDAVKAQISADAAAFGNQTDVIKQSLLARNPGLADVLEVTPGAEVINANSLPGTLDAVLAPDGIIGLPASGWLTFPEGFSGGSQLVATPAGATSGSFEVSTTQAGLRIIFNRSTTYQSINVQPGQPIAFPNGTGAALVSVDGIATLPDGSRITLRSSFGAATALPPGAVVVPSGVRLTVEGALDRVEAVLPAGSYALHPLNFEVLAMPAGTRVTATAALNFQLQGGATSVAVVLPTSGEYRLNGVQVAAVPGQSSQVLLNTAGTDAVRVGAETGLTWGAAGQVRADAAGALYGADGQLLRYFAAGDTVDVGAGEVMRLDAAGAVTTLTAALPVSVSGGYGIPAAEIRYDQIAMRNTAAGQSWLDLSGGSRITISALDTRPNYSFRSTVTGLQVYAPDGTLRIASTTQTPTRNIVIYPGETVVMPASGGRLTLFQFNGQIAAAVTGGSYVLGGTAAIETVVEYTTVAATPPSADLVLAQDWDLAHERFGPDRVPGILTMRAAGNVVINASLSDGFAGGVAGTGLLDDHSWSYRLIGGADFAGAGVLGVQPEFQAMAEKGNVIIRPSSAEDVRVRTGTGRIDLAAARDISIGSLQTFSSASGSSYAYQYAGLYSAGRPANIQPAGGAFSTLLDGRRVYDGGRFTLAYGGGDVSLFAQRDVLGAPRDSAAQGYGIVSWQSPEQWLAAQGGLNETSGLYTQQVAWGPVFSKYREGVATLGGGNMAVTAGRDIVALNAAASDAGVYMGATPADPELLTIGGGDLALQAGRDANGNILYVARGSGSLDVGRYLGSAAKRDYGSQSTTYNGVASFGGSLSIGAAALDVTARGDVTLTQIYNPISVNAGGGNGTARFSTYDASSALKVTSITGDVTLAGSNKTAELNLPGGPRTARTDSLLPGTVEAVAYNGDIAVGTDATVYVAPSPGGDLTLLANQSLTLGSLVMSDADPSVLSTPYATELPLYMALSELIPDYWPAFDRSLVHSASLYRGEDVNPVRLYAVEGDLTGSAGSVSQTTGGLVALPKPAEIRAGRDIAGLKLTAQNFHDGQTTVLSAGRDIVLDNLVSDGLNREPSAAGLWIGGPGRVEVSAGRDIDLGTGNGVQSVGNRLNPYLSEGRSADILLAAGMGAHGPDYAGFAAAYLNPAATSGRHSYAVELRDFMREHSGDNSLDESQAWEQFAQLSDGERNAFIRQTYYRELARAGTAGVESGDYNDGYLATATLFPTDSELFPADRPLSDSEMRSFSERWASYRALLPEYYGGELSLRYSQVRSLYDGSIDILVPGGGVDGGLSQLGPDIRQTGNYRIANTTATRDYLKSANQLGIVALRGGDVNIMAYDDVIVNQSRIFAIGGGDLAIWSSEGDINAGKGAKTAVLAPPPRLVFDPASGGFSLELTGAATGSGIATLITEPGQEPGNIWLMAPHGTVDAGDAGIRVSGNLVLAAQEVRGVDNIEVEGQSFGVPTNTVNVAALTDASAAASQAVSAAQDVVQRERAAARQNLPSIFSVRVLGFGSETARASEGVEATPRLEGAPDRGLPYDRASPVQFIGVGADFDSDQLSRLSDEQRRELRQDP